MNSKWNPTTTSFYLFIGETYAKGHIFSQPRHITKSKLVGCLNKGFFFKQGICRNRMFSFTLDIEREQQSKADSAWREGPASSHLFHFLREWKLVKLKCQGSQFHTEIFSKNSIHLCYQHFVRACLFWIISAYCILNDVPDSGQVNYRHYF